VGTIEMHPICEMPIRVEPTTHIPLGPPVPVRPPINDVTSADVGHESVSIAEGSQQDVVMEPA
jgi:hypothetical protein